jgi:hypothetical protein
MSWHLDLYCAAYTVVIILYSIHFPVPSDFRSLFPLSVDLYICRSSSVAPGRIICNILLKAC